MKCTYIKKNSIKSSSPFSRQVHLFDVFRYGVPRFTQITGDVLGWSLEFHSVNNLCLNYYTHMQGRIKIVRKLKIIFFLISSHYYCEEWLINIFFIYLFIIFFICSQFSNNFIQNSFIVVERYFSLLSSVSKNWNLTIAMCVYV